VQIAKAAGATVTAVCGTESVALVSTLGADRVIDYKKQDLTKPSDRYDIIFDAVGALSFCKIRKNLTSSGRYITTLPNAANVMTFLFIPLLSLFGYSKKCALVSVRPSGSDLNTLGLLIQEKKVIPLIDRTYAMEEIREAHAYSETGHAKGKIVIKIS
jgi:NADPH:quinone reductase-like Zn-dependent oxidoreductase